MIHAIFSDLHADEVGLAKLLGHERFRTADYRICLGDVIDAHRPESAVDYYQKVQKTSDVILLGNHEAVLIGACDISTFNPKRRAAISAAKTYFESSKPDFLKELAKLPLHTTVGEADMRHASYDPAQPWQHIRYTDDVQDQANYLPGHIHFIGHGHIPFIAWQEAGLWFYQRQIYGKSFKLSPDTPYVINAGSILGSREMRHYERTFLTFDDAHLSVHFYNLEENV